MIFYSDRLVPKDSAACARGPFIFICPKYRGDVGLLEHERTHVKQWFVVTAISIAVFIFFAHAIYNRTSFPVFSITPFFMAFNSVIYTLFPKYRLYSELEAYKVQARYYHDDRRPLFARFICDKYRLSVNYDDVLADLNRK